MDWWTRLCVGVAAALVGGCMPASLPPPPKLDHRWLIGIEHIRGDPQILRPLTNRFLADLAGMTNVQVVFVGVDLNGFEFNANGGDKLRVYPWLRAGGHCMELTYVIYRAGQQQRTYGLVVPALAAGPEPDTACVDRAASSFYRALAEQGL